MTNGYVGVSSMPWTIEELEDIEMAAELERQDRLAKGKWQQRDLRAARRSEQRRRNADNRKRYRGR